jgi:hypothetical protein
MGRHPKWKEISPRTCRLRSVSSRRPTGSRATKGVLGTQSQAVASLRPVFEQFVAGYTATTGKKSLSSRELETLFGEFKRFLDS